ncbi:MAG TPA: glucose 1-dehydrogenase [Bryobacteraceae bacterium]|jgi:NAD(P)-dependent dehydrogenase (short-subunit alcohol dehydrogenase family)|nr:glucose 1-dehydrogenase [Bryobacteraceae bacterium]
MLLDNKVVFLTGAANGIGRECAIACVREGASVVVADVDVAKAAETAAELGPAAMAIDCDVSHGAAVERAVAAALDRFGRLDAVHNNAGISTPSKPLDETTEAEWDRLMGVNLKSLLWTTRAALPALKRSRGTILNTASLVGSIGQSNHAAYSASKGAMITLTKSMALDYAPFGIRVNAICPAGVWTPMLEDWASEQPDPAKIHTYLDQIHALGYCPKGDVIGDAAVFLLSERARFITGCILPVSGGAELGYRR